MSDLLAILHTPGSSEDTKKGLINKFNNILDQLNIGRANIKVNLRFPINDYLANTSEELLTVVIGWGLREKPSWERIIPKPNSLASVRQLIAIDLFERKGLDGRVLEKPLINAGKFWSRRMQLNNQTLFLEGNFLQASTPYGLKRVEVFCAENNTQPSMPVFTFEPGEPSEVEIVRMIFELFVDHDHNRSEICNLLNAQEVKAPQKNRVWTPRTIKTILKCPFYIGANKYLGFIRLNVFTPIIVKSVYFEAQARIS